jgi:hypothetical protein
MEPRENARVAAACFFILLYFGSWVSLLQTFSLSSTISERHAAREAMRGDMERLEENALRLESLEKSPEERSWDQKNETQDGDSLSKI